MLPYFDCDNGLETWVGDPAGEPCPRDSTFIYLHNLHLRHETAHVLPYENYRASACNLVFDKVGPRRDRLFECLFFQFFQCESVQSQARKLMDLLRKPVGTSPRRNGLVPRKAVRGILWVVTVEIT